jgi:hypothetical protein
MSGMCSILVENPEGKGPLARPRCRWENDIKLYLQEVRWGMNGLIWLTIGQGDKFL